MFRLTIYLWCNLTQTEACIGFIIDTAKKIKTSINQYKINVFINSKYNLPVIIYVVIMKHNMISVTKTRDEWINECEIKMCCPGYDYVDFFLLTLIIFRLDEKIVCVFESLLTNQRNCELHWKLKSVV